MMTMIKPNQKTRSKKSTAIKKEVNSILGLPNGADDESNVDINLRPRSSHPSAQWDSVKAEQIGDGFEAVDVSVFDNPPQRKGRIRLAKFKNRFVIGTSRFITFDAKASFEAADTKKKSAPPPINAKLIVTKSERRKFSSALDTNIKQWRSFFVNDLLPVSLSINTAIEETKDQMSQLVDDSITLPVDFIRLQAIQAIYLRISREMGDKFKLTPAELELLHPVLNPLKDRK